MNRSHPLRALILVAAAAVALAGCSTTGKNMQPPPAEPMAETPAPMPKPTPPPPQPMPKPAPEIFIIGDVNFEFDKARLTPQAADILDVAAKAIKSNPDVRYEVAGHTDSIGSVRYNQGLSERRAQSVYDYLVSHGVPPRQLTTRGYSESRPVASNATDAGRAENRRVEISPLN